MALVLNYGGLYKYSRSLMKGGITEKSGEKEVNFFYFWLFIQLVQISEFPNFFEPVESQSRLVKCYPGTHLRLIGMSFWSLTSFRDLTKSFQILKLTQDPRNLIWSFKKHFLGQNSWALNFQDSRTYLRSHYEIQGTFFRALLRPTDTSEFCLENLLKQDITLAFWCKLSCLFSLFLLSFSLFYRKNFNIKLES